MTGKKNDVKGVGTRFEKKEVVLTSEIVIVLSKLSPGESRVMQTSLYKTRIFLPLNSNVCLRSGR